MGTKYSPLVVPLVGIYCFVKNLKFFLENRRITFIMQKLDLYLYPRITLYGEQSKFVIIHERKRVYYNNERKYQK
jgi:hypothetical protein